MYIYIIYIYLPELLVQVRSPSEGRSVSLFVVHVQVPVNLQTLHHFRKLPEIEIL